MDIDVAAIYIFFLWNVTLPIHENGWKWLISPGAFPVGGQLEESSSPWLFSTVTGVNGGDDDFSAPMKFFPGWWFLATPS